MVWTYTAPAGITRLDIVPVLAGKDFAVVASAGTKETLVRLGPDGKQSAPPLEIPGALGSTTPDLRRFVVHQRTKVVVMDTQGGVLWTHEPVSTKVAEAVSLLPGGERVAITIGDEANVYRTTLVDLKGKTVWEAVDESAGDLLHADEQWLFLHNARSVWRVNSDGTDKHMIIPQRSPSATILIALDGSAVAEQRPDGGKLYSGDGEVLADLPAGEYLFLSSDGSRLLLRQGKSTYLMVNRKGKPVWQLDLPQDVRSSALSPDGSMWLAVWREEGGASLRAALYGEAGARLWDTSIPLESALRNKAVSTVLNAEAGLVYVVVGNTVFALSLR